MSNHKGDPRTMAQRFTKATEEPDLRGKTTGGTKVAQTGARLQSADSVVSFRERVSHKSTLAWALMKDTGTYPTGQYGPTIASHG